LTISMLSYPILKNKWHFKTY